MVSASYVIDSSLLSVCRMSDENRLRAESAVSGGEEQQFYVTTVNSTLSCE